jgi:protein transport protein SEC61 subunit alpha
MAIAEGLAYIWSGAYGDINQIGPGNALLILVQLTFAGVIVTMLDEMLQKGYGKAIISTTTFLKGLGSGISLFIATNVSENILWRSFSPITIKTESGTEFEGALINFVHLLITKSNKSKPLKPFIPS